MDITANYHKGADTSIQAHGETRAETRLKYRTMILRKIYDLNTATCDEVERALQLPHQTVSARISELKKEMMITDTGARRLTENHKPARVYIVSENVKKLYDCMRQYHAN